MRILPVSRSTFLAMPIPAVVSRTFRKGYLEAGVLGCFVADFGLIDRGANCVVRPATSSAKQWQAHLRTAPELTNADPDFVSHTYILAMMMRPVHFEWMRFADDLPVQDGEPFGEDDLTREPATIIAFPRPARLRVASGPARSSE